MIRIIPKLSSRNLINVTCRYSSSIPYGQVKPFTRNDASYLGDALSIDGSIETVALKFERHSPPNHNHQTDAKSPVIILHGLFGSKTNTRTVSKQLAQLLHRNVYCLDLRNFGESPHINRLDYPSLAADVERFIDESKFESKPILVGHSMGAKTVMAVALRRPDLAKMVVSVDNAPVDLSGSNASNFGKYVNQLRLALEKYQYTNIKDVDRELAKVESNIVVRQFLLTNLNRGKKEDIIKSKIPLDVIGNSIANGSIAAWPFDSNLVRWSKGPTLFIRGSKSKYVPDDILPDIGSYFPDFEIREIEAGHWVISENPEEFKKVLVEFIERKEDDI
ncbi:Alpha/Beta hydrolase protein [Scheffersomyces coipomensis]|uniref:Alpha/Beta hydrolase protein n=1 Tax=Scheffersomyces coipomensis TaxID=1788519 RepID=UPI00315C7B91